MIAPTDSPSIARLNASDPSVTPDKAIEIIQRDGGVIIENLISREEAEQIKRDLKPHFDNDIPDKSGFFPSTTQRATGLLGISDACVDLACNPFYIDVANKMVSSTFKYWREDHQVTCTGKPIISSTVGFRVNPGGRQQVLHRDDKYGYLLKPAVGGCY
jgi:ectoine hydroxylase-related dioxygenase (phytanoyl-CoA dioxygenase family)